MKVVIAIVRPNKLEYVTSALRRGGVKGATVTQAKGFGAETAVSDWDMSGELTEKVKIEVVLEDEDCDKVVDLIQKTIGTGKAGAGFIYVQDVAAKYSHWKLNE